MKKKTFIRTSDEATAKKLRESGFSELKESSTTSYCFLNDGTANFSKDDELNMVYTDKMYG